MRVTHYPCASDGYWSSQYQETWALARSVPTSGDDEMSRAEIGGYLYNGVFSVYRAFFAIDLTSRTASISMGNASLGLASEYAPDVEDEPTLCLFTGAQSDPLTEEDFNNFGSVELASRVPTPPEGEPVVFNLNPVGIAYLNTHLGEIVKFCVRAASDVDNVEPTADLLSEAYITTKESTGPAHKPELLVYDESMEGFPKLGPIWTAADEENCTHESAARFDMIFAEYANNPTWDTAVRALNSNTKIIGSVVGLNACECNVYPDTPDPANWPVESEAAQPPWMLTSVGSTLASGINNSEMVVTPASLTTDSVPFANQALADGNSDGVPDSFDTSGLFDSSATLTRLPTGGYTGGAAIRVQVTGAGWGGLKQTLAVTPGQSLYPEIWLRATGDGGIGAQLEALDSNGLVVESKNLYYNTEEDTLTHIPMDDGWYPVTNLYVVPTGVASVRLLIIREDGVTSADMYISNFLNVDIPLFDAGKLVTIGGTELARIGTVGATTLTLDVRGIGDAGASAHSTGARIAQVVTMWADTVPVMDLTDQCPTVDVGSGAETWVDFITRREGEVFAASDWDGLMLDRADSNESWMIRSSKTRSIDYLRDNTLVLDYSTFDDAWNTGQLAIVTGIRALIGDGILIANQPYPAPAVLDGAYFEEQPAPGWTLATWNLVIKGPYDADHYSLFDTMATYRGPYSHLGTYSYADQGTQPWIYTHVPNDDDYRLMRFGLTSCLLVGAYYVWEPREHHSVRSQLWADEFDAGGIGTGYLGIPVGPEPIEVIADVWRRDYEHGVALCNPSDAEVTFLLDGTYTKIDGTQQPLINDGSTVTSITIPAHDGIILLGENESVPTPLPTPEQPFVHYIWVFNPQEELVAVLSNVLPEACPYWDDAHHQQLDGYETYEFVCPGDHASVEFLVNDALLCFPDLDGVLKMFRVKHVEELVAGDGTRTRLVKAEMAAMELMDAVILPYGWVTESATTIATALLSDTRWEPGDITVDGVASVILTDFQPCWGALQILATKYNAEVSTRVVVENSVIIGRYVDIVPRLGEDTHKLLEYAKDIGSLKRTGDSPQLYTAMVGLGRSMADGSYVNFSASTWSTPTNPADKPAGQYWVSDNEALQRWGYPHTGGPLHRTGVFQDPDEEDPALLLQHTWDALQKFKVPQYSYEVDVIALERMREQKPGDGTYEHEKMRIGDTVWVRDLSFIPELAVAERVVEVDRCYSDATQDKVVLGKARNLITSTWADLLAMRARMYSKEGAWSGWTG